MTLTMLCAQIYAEYDIMFMTYMIYIYAFSGGSSFQPVCAWSFG